MPAVTAQTTVVKDEAAETLPPAFHKLVNKQGGSLFALKKDSEITA